MVTLQIPATDGYLLGASHYEPARDASLPVRVVIAGATGVPQAFYRRFSEYLARAGHAVVTFDYRGIGRSREGSLRGFSASFLDWAEKDLDAVVRWSLDRGPTVVVGHSFGGQAYGLLSSAPYTLGLYAFGTGAGWHGYMPKLEQPKVWLMWNVVGPLLTTANGYLPSRYVGLGEDLPLDVYRQWREWCRRPNYLFGDPAHDFLTTFARVTQPIVAVNAADDAWAPPRSAAALMAGYTKAQVEMQTVDTAGLPIGHMGYFRAAAEPQLWGQAAAWIRARTPNRQS